MIWHKNIIFLFVQNVLWNFLNHWAQKNLKFFWQNFSWMWIVRQGGFLNSESTWIYRQKPFRKCILLGVPNIWFELGSVRLCLILTKMSAKMKRESEPLIIEYKSRKKCLKPKIHKDFFSLIPIFFAAQILSFLSKYFHWKN